MKISFIRKTATVVTICLGTVSMTLMNSCAETKNIAAKSGAQLWAENCQRCHNTPPPGAFSQEQWKTIGMHMQTRALLTTPERDKIVAFLQQSN
ncbi:MAG: cytochrome c [Taibaiella sp.]|nr:cytochrome c [Taibaiella sp.]